MQDKIVIVFNIVSRNESYDLEIPTDITTKDLVIGLNEAFGLDIDTSDINKCYLKSENPIALMRGNKKITDYRLRNGSIIYYTD